jgi:phosphoglycolate phosphatase-like HAD superfamily hydrolase
MNITGAIFDFDGTVFDSMHIWKGVKFEFFDRIGLVLSEQDKKDFSKLFLFFPRSFFLSFFVVFHTCETAGVFCTNLVHKNQKFFSTKCRKIQQFIYRTNAANIF